MQLYISIALLCTLLTSVLAQKVDTYFGPIKEPSEGETIAKGSKYQVKWTMRGYYPGHVKFFLMQGSDTDDLDEVLTMTSVKLLTTDDHFQWDVPVSSYLDTGDDYYVKMEYVEQKNITALSDKFTIVASPDSGESSSSSSSGDFSSTSMSSSIDTASSPTTTSFKSVGTAGTPTTVSTTVTTSSPTGAATHAAAPIAFLGAAAVGALIL